MKEYFDKLLIESLNQKGIDIHSPNYKESENYNNVKNAPIYTYDGAMTVEEYIERSLLTPQELIDSYSSIYDMGNPYELSIDECEYANIAYDIIKDIPEDEETIERMKSAERSMDIIEMQEANKREAANVLAQTFIRPDGYIAQLKKHLNLDLDLFDDNTIRNKREKAKIIHFLYMLREKHFPDINALILLSKPSMENIDNTSLDMATYNGKIIGFIKHALEKELDLSIKQEIKDTVSSIVSDWYNSMNNAQILMNFEYGNGYEYDFEETIRSLQSASEELAIAEKVINYRHSPIELLYLKIVQHEYHGNIKDIMIVNSIQTEAVHVVPPELVEKMKELHYKAVDFDNVEEYIQENALSLAGYVYLGAKTDKEMVRKIRECKDKVRILLDFCIRARPLLDIKDIANELQLVSLLQAIILDSQNKIFDYTFYAYQRYMKNKPRVQAALKINNEKDSKYEVDALKIYWVRKVSDHWYANIGRNEARARVRKLENVCDMIIRDILNQPNLDEMLDMHMRYTTELDYELISTNGQIEGTQLLVRYLYSKGFEYKDHFYKIRYAFLSSKEIVDIYNKLASIIDSIIENKKPSAEVTVETPSSNGEYVIMTNFKLCFDYENKICIMQKINLKEFNRNEAT